MAGTDDLEASAAWQAIPRSLRKVYAAITTEIAAQGGTEGRITYEDFQDGHGTSQPASALRTLRYLKPITVEPGIHLGGTYKTSDGWRDLDEKEVARLVALAREIRPRPERQMAVGQGRLREDHGLGDPHAVHAGDEGLGADPGCNSLIAARRQSRWRYAQRRELIRLYPLGT